MPSALYGLGKLALVFGANTGMLRIDYLCLTRNKPSNEVNFLIINVVKVLRAEETLFGHLGYKYRGKLDLSQDLKRNIVHFWFLAVQVNNRDVFLGRSLRSRFVLSLGLRSSPFARASG